jgi:VRR-NUC domain-containing protein
MPYDERWLTDVLARGQVRLVGGAAPAGPPAISERAFQQAVLRVAKDCGWAGYFTKDSRRSPSGFPDLVLVRPPTATQPGTALFWELKRADGIVTLQQAHWLRLLGQVTQVEAGVWRPEAWSTLVERLRG